MKRRIFFIFLLVSITSNVFAKIKLPHILSDNMVLQQKSNVNLWGTANPNTKIVIKTSWNRQKYTAQSDEKGGWKLSLPTSGAGGPYEISISDGEELKLKNIFLGEVWLCSGQSNMEMPLKGFKGQPVEGANDIIAKAKKEQPIHMFTSANEASNELLDDILGTWSENSNEAVSNCSATAYFFAKYIQEALNVPVGIIVSSWGGTRIEAWMSKETLATPMFKDSIQKRRGYNGASQLYNAKLYPLSNYTIKGALWYQGESNVGHAAMYEKLFPAFVNDFRKLWGKGEIPFYYVQIAPFDGSHDTEHSKISEYARLRESQLKSLKNIPNSEMVVTLDIGEEDCIHPAKKEQVGNRLAYCALAKTYGVKGVGYRAPEYKSLKITANKAYLSFNFFSSTCLGPMQVNIENFEIAGEDKVFYKAKAKIDQRLCDTVEVYSENVPHPVAVRYAYKNFIKAVLYDDTGLPVSSFRTDNW